MGFRPLTLLVSDYICRHFIVALLKNGKHKNWRANSGKSFTLLFAWQKSLED